MGWKEDLNYGLAAFGVRVPDGLPLDRWAATLDGAPCRNAAAVVGASSVLFYALERGHNPKVNDLFDAMVYTSTCLSVGYGDIFAKTPLGKLLGSALMTVGPALAAKTLDGLAAERRDAHQSEMLETLRQILDRLPDRPEHMKSKAGPDTIPADAVRPDVPRAP